MNNIDSFAIVTLHREGVTVCTKGFAIMTLYGGDAQKEACQMARVSANMMSSGNVIIK